MKVKKSEENKRSGIIDERVCSFYKLVFQTSKGEYYIVENVWIVWIIDSCKNEYSFELKSKILY